MNPKVDWFFEKHGKWQEAFSELRLLVLQTCLTEELKWGCPCYTYQNQNVILIHGFKDYCALLFMQGALIHDSENILVQQTENVQAARQIRFKNVDQILDLRSVVLKYINEAIAIQKSGVKVEMKKIDQYPIPNEFQNLLDQMPELKIAFESLTPGRQKGYIFYFSSAKQPKTREDRIMKYVYKILDGKGLDD
jgi:uncharacterized protein YdeI (YjbR/CyaY-like superfamily)